MVVGVRGGVGVTPTIWVWTAVDGVRDVDTITDSSYSYTLPLWINELGDIVGTNSERRYAVRHAMATSVNQVNVTATCGLVQPRFPA